MSGRPSDTPCVVVVGGGMSGLAAAYRLVEASQHLPFPLDVKLLEASGRLGGVIQTTECGGLLLEGGPDSFISEKPWALDLCQRLGLGPHLIGSSKVHRRSFIVRRGRLLPVPEGFYLLAPSLLWPFVTTPIFSWWGKLRIAADLVLPRKNHDFVANHDESLADFVRRRLGQEALERMAQPMVGGIYTSDPELLSLRATMPRFLEMERRHRSVILGILRQRQPRASAEEDRPQGPRYSLFLSFDRGMQMLVDSLQSRLPAESVCLHTAVESLDRNPSTGRWVLNLGNGTHLEADAVCLALASYQSAKLLQHFDSSLSERLRLVPYASTATVNLAYPRAAIPHPLNGFGFVVPAIERRQILACTFCHVKFEGRAPEGQALLRAFVGGALQPKVLELDDHEMIRAVRQDLRDLLGVTVEPVLSRVERHPQAMAQYQVGHLEWVAEVESCVKEYPTLQLAGNAFTGVGIPDCVHRGEESADKILAALRTDLSQGVGQ
jgi:protoporphyrinogen/coproporphyrinogen III oxidase